VFALPPAVIKATVKIVSVLVEVTLGVPANELVTPSNAIVGYPFNPFDDQTVLPAFPIDVPLKPLPDLSFHALTLDAELNVRLAKSAASNHRTHPGISIGWKGRVYTGNDGITGTITMSPLPPTRALTVDVPEVPPTATPET
jgi:hypothetical protein